MPSAVFGGAVPALADTFSPSSERSAGASLSHLPPIDVKNFRIDSNLPEPKDTVGVHDEIGYRGHEYVDAMSKITEVTEGDCPQASRYITTYGISLSDRSKALSGPSDVNSYVVQIATGGYQEVCFRPQTRDQAKAVFDFASNQSKQDLSASDLAANVQQFCAEQGLELLVKSSREPCGWARRS